MYISVRLKFSRLGPVRFLGHLDMLRYFQKAVMRCELPIRYSEGFNPHQIMSFAYPLGVSMETIGDYMDIDLLAEDGFHFENASAREKYEQNIMDSLNAVMHEGIRVEQASVIPEGEWNAMASVYAADYEVAWVGDVAVTQTLLDHILARSELFVEKEGKKGTRIVDIRSGILSLSCKDEHHIFMKLRSGSEENIKPSTILKLISAENGVEFPTVRIKRLEIYRNTENGLKALGDFSVANA